MTFPPVPGASLGRPPYGVKYGDELPAYGAGMLAGAGLTALYSAIANRDNARADIVCIGDSITEGEGAASFSGTWVQNANRAIREAYPTVANGSKGGLGFVPVFTTGETSFTWPWTLVSGTPGTTDLGPVRGCLFASSAISVSYTAPAGTTSVKIMYYDGSPGTNGTFNWNVNGGANTPISNGMTSVDKLSVSIPLTVGQVLNISWVSGIIAVDGIVHFAGDETSGVTFHECGHYGWDAGTTSTGWNQPESLAGLNWAQCFAGAFPTTPAAVLLYLGANDANSYTAAQFGNNVQALLTLIRSQAGMSTVPWWLIAGYPDQATPLEPGGWPAYVAALRTLAAANLYTHVTDVSYRYPPVSYAAGAYYFNNGIGALGGHPSALGHRLLGEIIAAGARIA